MMCVALHGSVISVLFVVLLGTVFSVVFVALHGSVFSEACVALGTAAVSPLSLDYLSQHQCTSGFLE